MITGKELAAELRLPMDGIAKLRRQRKIPFIKLSYRTVRYDLAKVREALARFEVKAVS
jgi:hypothetical protein